MSSAIYNLTFVVYFDLRYLQVRELKYKLDQSRESVQSHETTATQLRDQLDRLDTRCTRELEARREADLHCCEAEQTHRDLAVVHGSLQNQLTETVSLLAGEREARATMEGLYREQGRLYTALKADSERAGEDTSHLSGRLDLADKTMLGTCVYCFLV